MTDYTQILRGERVRDGLGHWYEVVEGGPFQYLVQPLTLRGVDLRPFGVPVRMFRSDMRRDDER